LPTEGWPLCQSRPSARATSTVCYHHSCCGASDSPTLVYLVAQHNRPPTWCETGINGFRHPRRCPNRIENRHGLLLHSQKSHSPKRDCWSGKPLRQRRCRASGLGRRGQNEGRWHKWRAHATSRNRRKWPGS
jgi:hypothetical protein